MKSSILLDKKSKIKEKRFDFWAYLAITVFVLIFILLSFGRHDSLQSYLNDLGNYDQLIWNTLQGNFFQISVGMMDTSNYLSGHFSPILLFFVPFYAIWENPKWLLVFQSLAVGLGAVPIYLLAKEKLKNYWAALVFLLSYLLNPFLHNALLYDFHEVCFAVVFASWAFYFLEKRKNKLFIISSIFLAISQEHLVLLVFMMGLYALFIQKRKKFGFWVSASSLIYFVLTLAVFMPYFSQSGNLALLEVNARYGSRYAWLGSSMPEIIKNITKYPDIIFKFMLSRDRLLYLFFLVLPVFSLAIYSWPIIIIFPILAINLLSSNSMTYDIFFYHSAIVIPFVYFSAIASFGCWFSTDKFLRRAFLLAITISSLLSFHLFSLVGISGFDIFAENRPNAHARRIAEVKKLIPRDASLSVQHNLGPHFTERAEVYRFPVKKDEAEYILLDYMSPYGESVRHFADFGYALQVDIFDWQRAIRDFFESSNHDLIYEGDGFLIFKKKQ